MTSSECLGAYESGVNLVKAYPVMDDFTQDRVAMSFWDAAQDPSLCSKMLGECETLVKTKENPTLLYTMAFGIHMNANGDKDPLKAISAYYRVEGYYQKKLLGGSVGAKEYRAMNEQLGNVLIYIENAQQENVAVMSALKERVQARRAEWQKALSAKANVAATGMMSNCGSV